MLACPCVSTKIEEWIAFSIKVYVIYIPWRHTYLESNTLTESESTTDFCSNCKGWFLNFACFSFVEWGSKHGNVTPNMSWEALAKLIAKANSLSLLTMTNLFGQSLLKQIKTSFVIFIIPSLVLVWGWESFLKLKRQVCELLCSFVTKDVSITTM